MKPIWIVLGIVGLLVIVGIATYAGTYNQIIGLDENCKAKWGNVEAQYQRRLDLIPNLVETVKGYAEHERETLDSVTQARAGVEKTKADPNNPQAMQAYQQAQEQLSNALKGFRLQFTVERYPDLKANQNFLDLQTQLEGTENRIKTARVDYNEAVQAYNTQVRGFFTSMLFGGRFPLREMFQADAGAEKAPKVKF